MGDRVSIQFENDGDKSVVLFSHWNGMSLVEKAKNYVEELRKLNGGPSYPLGRMEPETMMVDFIRELTQDTGRVTSNYYLGATENDGDNSDNGHHIIDVNENYVMPGTIVTFKVSVDNSRHGEHIQIVTGELIGETDIHIKVNNFKRAIEEGEETAIRTYRKDNLLSEIMRVS